MEFLSLRTGELDQFGSRNIRLWEAGIFDGVEQTRVHIAKYGKDGLLGRHPTKFWQLFTVIDGSGWVSGDDGVRYPITAGEAVLWHPGEEHDSGSELGMSALILISTRDPRTAEG